MQSQEYLQSKADTRMGFNTVKIEDALIAIELKELETEIRIYKLFNRKDIVKFLQEQLSELKLKHNIL